MSDTLDFRPVAVAPDLNGDRTVDVLDAVLLIAQKQEAIDAVVFGRGDADVTDIAADIASTPDLIDEILG